MKVAPTHRGEKHKYKEIVIVPKVQEARVELENLTPAQKTFVANSKIDTSIQIHQTHMLPTTTASKQENYEFKNLAINNFVQTYSSQNYEEVVVNHIPNPDQMMKINNFNIEKKFYMPVYMEKVALHKHTAAVSAFVQSSVTCTKTEHDIKSIEGKSDDLQTSDAAETRTDNDKDQHSD